MPRTRAPRPRALASGWLTLGGALALLFGELAARATEPEAPKDVKSPSASSTVGKVKWGELDGKEVDLYTLTNKHGLIAKITNYGGIVVELHVPDRQGKLGDVVFGYDSLAEYVKKTPYFGATIGRVGNRIADAKFELAGKTYKLAANNGAHHLHGGKKGWDKVVWDAQPLATAQGPALKLAYSEGQIGWLPYILERVDDVWKEHRAWGGQ